MQWSVIKNRVLTTLIFISLSACSDNNKSTPDLILVNGRIITVDSVFSLAEALAIKGDIISAVGSSKDIINTAGSKTQIIDLAGKTVLPGLIDAHLHPDAASTSELKEEIPEIKDIDQLLTWIKKQSGIRKKGEWIVLQKFFFTRLNEMRPPTLEELDSAAPLNPVFLNGSFGGFINSCAMKSSGIDPGTDDSAIIKDNRSGKPTGFIRASAFSQLNFPIPEPLSEKEWTGAFINMMKRYNQYGITSVTSGTGSLHSAEIYRRMADSNLLTVRICQNILYTPEKEITYESVKSDLSTYKMQTGTGDKWVRIGPLKVFLDGGILTGTAYMKEPWGAKAAQVFNTNDPSYKGVITLKTNELYDIVSAANNAGWSFTAHVTGDGSLKMLLDVYNEINKVSPIKDKRYSVIHGNFFDDSAMNQMRQMGVLANIQPAWFFKDAEAMLKILGNERIKAFQPYKSLINKGIMLNGGSDHMVKWDANTSVNPYNPFTAIWSMVTRKTEKGSIITENEAISREDAIRAYTINNAFASFEENIKGSLEPGKLADMVVLTNDILNCEADSIRVIKAAMTIVGGKIVWDAGIIKVR